MGDVVELVSVGFKVARGAVVGADTGRLVQPALIYGLYPQLQQQ